MTNHARSRLTTLRSPSRLFLTKHPRVHAPLVASQCPKSHTSGTARRESPPRFRHALPLIPLHDSLNQAWETALTKAVSEFKHLVASAGSKSWKLVHSGSGANTPTTTSHTKAPPSTALPAAGYPFPDVSSPKAPRPSDVVVHRRTGKTGDTYRATLELPMSYFGEKGISIDTFARAINTPEAWTQCKFRSWFSRSS